MKKVLALILITFILSACGSIKQEIRSTQVELPLNLPECHINFVPSEDGALIEMTGSELCVDNTVIPYVFLNENNNQVYDGGVYVSSTSTWITRPGVFTVQHKNTNDTLATITVTDTIIIQ